MSDIAFDVDDGRFNLRVAGLLVTGDELLVMASPGLPYRYLPGGRVRLHETTEQALRRELREELGLDAAALRLAWVVEQFFREPRSQADFHELCFFYICEVASDSPLRSQRDFIRDEHGTRHRFSWVTIKALPDSDVLPKFLEARLRDTTTTEAGVVHFTHWADR